MTAIREIATIRNKAVEENTHDAIGLWKKTHTMQRMSLQRKRSQILNLDG
jgi:hypothetical protein